MLGQASAWLLIYDQASANFEGQPFHLPIRNTDEILSFDILLLTSKNIQLQTNWHQPLRFNSSNPEPQLVEFTFQVVEAGRCSLAADFYSEQRWLNTISLEFYAVEPLLQTPVSPEV